METPPFAENKFTPSPFLTMWTKPAETIRRIVDTDPKYFVLALAALSGAVSGLSNYVGRDLIYLGCGIILGPIFGILGLYITGAIYTWIGYMHGGRATSEQVRAAVAWSLLPTIAGSLLALLLAIFGTSTIANCILSLLAIYSLILLVSAIKEVHQFSTSNSIFTILTPVLVFVAIAFVVILILAVIGPALGKTLPLSSTSFLFWL